MSDGVLRNSILWGCHITYCSHGRKFTSPLSFPFLSFPFLSRADMPSYVYVYVVPEKENIKAEEGCLDV